MAYQPLTQEQFQSARKAGFSPEKITEMELKRKAQEGGTSTPTVAPKEDGFLKSLAKDIVRPAATLAARPIQLGAQLLGASPEAINKVNLGGTVAPVPTGIKDVVKDVGRAAELASYAVGGGAAKAGFKGAVKTAAVQGAKSGALYGAGSATAEGKNIGEIAKDTAIGATTGGALGGVVGGAVPAALKSVNAIRNLHVERAAKAEREFDDLLNTILQPKPKDASIARKIDSSKEIIGRLDTKGIRSYADLKDAITDKIEVFAGRLDQALDTDKTQRLLGDLKLDVKVGDAVVSNNFVDDALKQMDEYYTKVGDIKGKEQIKQLRAKADTQGLTIKEINDLARTHGRDLNAFNPSGELASGLSKQAAENTRAGLKSTARGRFDNELFKSVDSEITKLKNVQKLAEKMELEVQKLEQKIKARGLGEKFGRVIAKVLDITSGGVLKGGAQYFLPRGEGLKVLNAIDLEKNLSKNLLRLQKITDSEVSDDVIMKELNQFLSDHNVVPFKPTSLKK